jgi:hypothetical protein
MQRRKKMHLAAHAARLINHPRRKKPHLASHATRLIKYALF